MHCVLLLVTVHRCCCNALDQDSNRRLPSPGGEARCIQHPSDHTSYYGARHKAGITLGYTDELPHQQVMVADHVLIISCIGLLQVICCFPEHVRPCYTVYVLEDVQDFRLAAHLFFPVSEELQDTRAYIIPYTV